MAPRREMISLPSMSGLRELNMLVGTDYSSSDILLCPRTYLGLKGLFAVSNVSPVKFWGIRPSKVKGQLRASSERDRAEGSPVRSPAKQDWISFILETYTRDQM